MCLIEHVVLDDDMETSLVKYFVKDFEKKKGMLQRVLLVLEVGWDLF